jgi:transposase
MRGSFRILRLIRAKHMPPASTPRVLGVDDWALRKGQIYGTILIDLETHRPIDLLRERSAETLASWLKQHPGIEIISRDRSSDYAKGATQGAPLAIQVADRWHLLNNLREAVVAYLEQHRAGLLATAQPAPLAAVENTPSTPFVPVDPVLSSEIALCPTPALSISPPIAPNPSTPVPETASSEVSAIPMIVPQPEPVPSRKSHRLSQVRRTKRLERYELVLELHRQGHSIREIAVRLHLGRQTVKKFVRADAFPERASRQKRGGKLTPFEPYLQARWDEGCHNALQLFREIKAKGYTGSRLLVSMWAAPRRDQPRVRKVKTSSAPSKPKLPPIGEPAWSAKRAAWLVVLETTGLKLEEQEILERMKQADANLDVLNRLALDFRSMVRDRDVTKLADWMARAKASAIDVLQGFVRGLELDLKAVEAALKYTWSNGPTEGHVNRLKTIKRQMYGRANFDLLRRRVLGPPAVSQ